MSLTPDDLHAVLLASIEEGKLYWRPRPRWAFPSHRAASAWATMYEGKEALTATCRGYKTGMVCGQMVRAHRVVFAMANGRWPKLDVDHINGDRSDNRLINLREATRSQNLGNRRPDGLYKGISRDRRSGRWIAQITKNYQHNYLGAFDTPEEAALAYDAAAREKFGEFARCNFALESRLAVCPRA